MPFDRNIIDNILHNVDIVDVIGEYVVLKKTGRNFKGSCPFHQEKTPSLIVSPEKQIFHCFGCHAGGDVISFLTKIEHTSFKEAVETLGEKVGIRVVETKKPVSDKASEDKASFYQINQRVASYYNRYLNTSKRAGLAQEYITKRKLREETVSFFQLGYAPSHTYHSLVNTASKNRIDLKTLEKIGIIRKDKFGKYKDWFSNRLIFPIADVKGRIVGFGGRVLDDSLPKYLNSPETVLFKKSMTLYGLNLALQHIRKEEKVIVLEGYMDVIAMHQAGIKNVVATLGTALTQQHVNIIKRYAKEVVVLFDGDKAGIAASLKTVELFLNTGLDLKIVLLPENLDPDDFINQYGVHKMEELIENAQEAFVYQIEILAKEEDLNSLQGKKNFCKALFPLIAKLDTKLEQNFILKLAADKLNEDEGSLHHDLKQYIKSNKRLTNQKNSANTLTRFVLTEFRLEKDFLEFLINYPSEIKRAKKIIDTKWLSLNIKKAVTYLFDNYDEIKNLSINEILRVLTHEFDDENLYSLFTETLIGDRKEKTTQGMLEDFKDKLERAFLKNQLEEFKNSRETIDIAKYQELAKKLAKIN